MKVLTVRQPWAWAIFNGKDIENRDWPTNYRGPLAIHAGKGMTADEYVQASQFIFEKGGAWPPYRPDLVFGAILGVVELVDCTPLHPSAWFQGAYGFVLANPRPLANPVPCKGALSLWEPPADVLAAVNAQLQEAN